jgi:hypothetical protein
MATRRRLLPGRERQGLLQELDETGLARAASANDKDIERGRVFTSADLRSVSGIDVR